MDILREIESAVAASLPMVAASSPAPPASAAASWSSWLAPSSSSPQLVQNGLRQGLHRISSFIDNGVAPAIEPYLEGRSPSEIRFLASVFLAVLLFAVILPVCEAMSESYEERMRRERQRNGRRKSKGRRRRASEPKSRVRMYRPGLGVVEVDVAEVAETMLCRSSSGGSGCSRRGRLETIEESEEEECDAECEASTSSSKEDAKAEVCEEEKLCDSDSSLRSHDDDDLLLDTPTSSPPATPEQRQVQVLKPSDLTRRLQETFDQMLEQD